jgi:hypothetical protein
MKLNSKVGFSAVAAAVSLACAGVVDAATISATPVGFSFEGNSKAAATSIYSASVQTVLGAEYLANDTVTLTLENAEFHLGTSTASGVSGYNGAVVCSSTSMTLGYLSRSATTANYRVLGDTSSATGKTCTFALPIKRTSVQLGLRPLVSWSAKTGTQSISFDESAVKATVGSVVTQFAAANVSSALNATVDVDSSRYQFTSDDDTASLLAGKADTLTFTLNNSSSLEGAAAISSIVAVIGGDFSFIDNNGTAGCQASDLTGGHGSIKASTGTLTINSACSELTFTATSASAVSIAFGTNSTSITPTNGAIIDAPQTFSLASLTYNYGGNGSLASLGTATPTFDDDVGEWFLNGSISKVGYMPYGSGISRIVYITNRSTQTGAVSATAFDEAGNDCEIANVASARAGAVTVLSTGLDAGVRACFGADFSGKVAFEITANIPATGAEVYSAYNVNGNRVAVINNTNGK